MSYSCNIKLGINLVDKHCLLYSYYAEKIVSARLCPGSVSAERVEQGEVGGVTHRVLCTWQLLGLAVKGLWLALGGPILTLAAWTGLENTTLTL